VANQVHDERVRLILNVLWFIFGSGFILAIGYGVAALICFALIVTIPFGIASLRLAVYSLWPFGRTIVDRRDAGVAQCVTIIGIPFGIANFKLVPAALWPLGREIVDIDEQPQPHHV
jgi:uncharacterized membrane protein YccF (DUF307 family)